MARYTFTCEHFNYNDYSGKQESVASKHTTEFRADDLTTMLENFESFLRGAGFTIDGYLAVEPNYVPSSEEDDELEDWSESIPEAIFTNQRAWDWTVHQLMQTEPIVIADKQDTVTFSVGMGDYSQNYMISDNIDVGDISINLTESDYSIDLNQMTFDFTTEAKCSICKLSLDYMKNHTCFDPNCPLSKNAN